MATTNVHIIGVGYDPQPIINILRSSLPCDRVHLLWNPDSKIAASKERIVSTLTNNGFHPDDVKTEEVDVFDYQKVLNSIMLISQIEKNRAEQAGTRVQFYLNITHGTRLVTGALCTAAMMIGAQMYYLKERDENTDHLSIDDLIIRVPIPRVPDLDKLTDKRRKFLKMICSEANGLTVSELAEEFSSKQNVNQFVGYFENNNLVERIHEGKSVRIVPTELGRMAANWLI